MSTKIYIDFARRGHILDKPIEDEERFHGKKASLETKTKEKNEFNYTKRSNVCNVCFVVKSVQTHKCNCDE